MKLETIKSVEGFIKRIGFLTEPYMQISSTKFYMRKLIDNNPEVVGMIEIKKQATYERGVRSKVLVIHSLKSEAN